MSIHAGSTSRERPSPTIKNRKVPMRRTNAATGFKLANDGQDTRAIQHYLGHRNIQHTTRYTELAPDRFKDFWQD